MTGNIRKDDYVGAFVVSCPDIKTATAPGLTYGIFLSYQAYRPFITSISSKIR